MRQDINKGVEAMKSLIGSFIGLVLSVSVGAESLLEGQVRLSSGQPAAGVCRCGYLIGPTCAGSSARPRTRPGILRCRCKRFLRLGARLCRPILHWGRITPIRSILPLSYPTDCRRLPMCGWRCSTCWDSVWRRWWMEQRSGGDAHGAMGRYRCGGTGRGGGGCISIG